MKTSKHLGESVSLGLMLAFMCFGVVWMMASQSTGF